MLSGWGRALYKIEVKCYLNFSAYLSMSKAFSEKYFRGQVVDFVEDFEYTYIIISGIIL